MTGKRGRRRKKPLDGLKEQTGRWKLKKHKIGPCRELSWEEAMNLSQDTA
jgi:hypothetical protein